MKISTKQLIAVCLTALFAFGVAGCDADGPDAGANQPPAQGGGLQ